MACVGSHRSSELRLPNRRAGTYRGRCIAQVSRSLVGRSYGRGHTSRRHLALAVAFRVDVSDVIGIWPGTKATIDYYGWRIGLY